MEDLADTRVNKSDFLLEMLTAYSHPSISLWRAIEAKEIDAILDSNPVKGPMLDLGCGDGRFTKVALKGSWIDIGIDIFREPVSKAKQAGCYTNLGVADGSMLPFRTQSVGTVISNSVLEHIPKVSDVLRETARVLRDDGLLVFSVPSANFRLFLFPSVFARLRFLRGFSEWYSNKRNTLLEHRNLHYEETWRDWLREEGFTSIDCRHCMPRETVQLWDIMAVTTYLSMRALRRFPRLAKPVLRITKRMRIRMFGLILRKYYLGSAIIGGDLIVLATKRSPFGAVAGFSKPILARHES